MWTPRETISQTVHTPIEGKVPSQRVVLTKRQKNRKSDSQLWQKWAPSNNRQSIQNSKVEKINLEKYTKKFMNLVPLGSSEKEGLLENLYRKVLKDFQDQGKSLNPSKF